MTVFLGRTLACVAALAAQISVGTAATLPSFTGTWTSKSRTVFTGPGFYNPVSDAFIEPELPGISYSFTDPSSQNSAGEYVGWYEEAYYRAVSNPTTPTCPSAILQFQHGTYTVHTNGSISLNPIAVDGRQLSSSPCEYAQAIYTRYKQVEYFTSYEVVLDTYHNIERLNLAQFNGAPLLPLYLAYRPPQMLPTQTLNPTSAATGAASTANARRSFDEEIHPLEVLRRTPRVEPSDPTYLLWIGAGMVGIGSIAYIVF